MTDQQFSMGDHVEGYFPHTVASGIIQEGITGDTHAAGRAVGASDTTPQYLIMTSPSGPPVAHQPDMLQRREGGK